VQCHSVGDEFMHILLYVAFNNDKVQQELSVVVLCVIVMNDI
jgi:hypothetical protein